MSQAAMHNPPATIRVIAADIKLAHSVFAMPFAILGAFMAGRSLDGTTWADGSGQRFIEALVLIVVCMVLARTVAMLANRLLDRDIDRLNPRTAGRAIPSGRLPARSAAVALLLCAAAFMAACALFGVLHGNWWPVILGVPVLAWISAYPLLKRFTWLCHIYLGSSLAITPIAAAIAVHPDAVLAQPALWLLSGAVLFWVAGFDVLYALQDVDVDRRDGLHSIPAMLGVPGALWISRFLHAGTLALLTAALQYDVRLDMLFALGVGMTALLLIAEHGVIVMRGVAGINLAFFTLNGIVSCVLGLAGILDLLIH
jgi:4-hydroxybenzoate polyprenyltransferase